MIFRLDRCPEFPNLHCHPFCLPTRFVFVDLMMPVLSGIEMARALREWEVAHRRPPVPLVACTSEDVHTGSELWNKCFQAGMDEVMVS